MEVQDINFAKETSAWEYLLKNCGAWMPQNEMVFIPGPSNRLFGDLLTGGFWAPVITRKHLLEGPGR